MPVNVEQFKAAAAQKGYSPAQIDAYLQSKGISTEVAPAQPEKKSVGGFVGNVFKSGANLIGGVVSAVAHPVKTATALGGIVAGGAQKLIPGKQQAEGNFDSLVDFFKDRYGSPSKLGNTLYKDPVGVLGDIATVFSGGGAAVSKLGTISKVSKITRAGEALSTIGKVAEPISLMSKGVGKTVGRATGGKLVEGTTDGSRVGRSVGPFKSSFEADTASTFAKHGIEPSASMVSKSPAVGAIETLTERGLFGAKTVLKKEVATEKLIKVAEDAIKKSEGTDDISEAGMIIAKGKERAVDRFRDINDKIFNEAGLGEFKKAPVEKLDKSVKWLDNMIERKSNVVGTPPSDVKYFQELRKGLTGETTDVALGIDNTTGRPRVVPGVKPTIAQVEDTLDSIDKKVLDHNEPISTGNQGELKKLAATLREELETTIQSKLKAAGKEDVLLKRKQAKDYYKFVLDDLDTGFSNRITQYAKAGQYDKIVPAIMGPNVSIQDVPRMYELLGPGPKAAIQSTTLKEIFTKARGEGGVGEFMPEGIGRSIRAYSPEKLKVILTPEQYQTLLDVDKLSRAIGAGNKISKGSQTVFGLRILGEIGSVFVNPVGAITALLGDAVTSKIINSAAGQKFLTSGFETTGKIGKRIEQVGKVGKYATPLERLTEYNR